MPFSQGLVEIYGQLGVLPRDYYLDLGVLQNILSAPGQIFLLSPCVPQMDHFK